jgi:hypothetical protein
MISRLLPLALLALFTLQGWLASTLPVMPLGGDIGQPPGLLAAKVESLGEDAFFFRSCSLMLQHAGNLNGTIVPYYQLNYTHLQAWLGLLERFDSKAQITPTMASFLFGASQNGADTKYVIDYLEARALAHPADNWRWLGEAVYLARYRLKDQNRAQQLAHELAALPVALPAWAHDLELFVMVDRGDKEGAGKLLAALTDTAPDENERRWTQYYYDHILAAAP